MTNSTRHERPVSTVFSPEIMSPEHALSVIDSALDHRANASNSIRIRFNSAIMASVNIPGFRDASIAPRQQLRDRILATILVEEVDKLAGAVLQCWTEANDPLRNVVADRLRSRDMKVEGPDWQRGIFNSVWARHEWTAEAEVIANGASDDQLDADDVSLMLCCLSGRVPTLEATVEMESPTFQKWLDELSELPPEAPEWDHVDDFASSVKGLALEKITERVTVQVEAVADFISEIRGEFKDDLLYLELDISSWSAEDVVRANLVDAALEQVTELKSALSEYRPIRPQAPSRSEESLRAPERVKFEKVLLDIVGAWDEMMKVPETPVDDTLSDDPLEEAHGNIDEATAEVDSTETSSGSDHDSDSTGADLGLLRQDIETLSSENERLERDGLNLREDKSKLGQRISRIRDELSKSREMQEYWRRAYVSESAGQARPEEEQPAQIANVNDAIELARTSFPGRLCIALNSKSNGNTPFQRPDEVFDALGWLATEYHRRRSNPGAAPNFDKLIKESCPGWSYKSKQTDVTKEQFTEWYTTTLDGKSYELDAHIGKGTSFDPQQTIRIAFDWDDELKQVIVGYVGRHQRSRRS